MEHWYGLPEALFTNKTIQDYPVNYNYSDESHRFEEAGKLWKQAAPPYSEHWNKVMNELLSLGYVLTALLAWQWMNEPISAMRWAGIGVIIVGVWLVSRS